MTVIKKLTRSRDLKRAEQRGRAEACLRRGRKEREHGFAKEESDWQNKDCRVI